MITPLPLRESRELRIEKERREKRREGEKGREGEKKKKKRGEKRRGGEKKREKYLAHISCDTPVHGNLPRAFFIFHGVFTIPAFSAFPLPVSKREAKEGREKRGGERKKERRKEERREKKEKNIWRYLP